MNPSNINISWRWAIFEILRNSLASRFRSCSLASILGFDFSLLWNSIDSPGSLNSLYHDKRWCLKLILVGSLVKFSFFLQKQFYFFAHLIIDLVDKQLLLLGLLNTLLHEAEGIGDDLPVEFELYLFSLNSFVLLLDLDWEKVHHVIVLMYFLKLLSLQMFMIPNFIKSFLQLFELPSILLLILLSLLLQLIALVIQDGHFLFAFFFFVLDLSFNITFNSFARFDFVLN